MSAPEPPEGPARPRLAPVAPSTLPPGALRSDRRIRFSDCDPAGIAYTGRLIDLMNGAIEELFEARLGLDYGEVIQVRRLGLGYGRVDCDFFRPLGIGDRLSVCVLVARLGRGSVAWRVHLHGGEDEAARGQLTTVATDLDTHRAAPIPYWLRAPLEAYRRACA